MRIDGLSALVERNLPSPTKCDQVSLRKGEAIVHAPGFEDRTMALVQVATSDVDSKAILLDYRPINPKNRLAAVRDALSNLATRLEDDDVLVYDRFAPGDFEDRLKARLIFHGATSVLLDISTMSKLATLLVLNVCFQLRLGVRVFYAEASTYGPSREEFELAKRADKVHQPTLQIFTGVHGVVRVNSLASVAMQGQPTAALVFMSFNDALTQVLLNTVYPGRLLLINGRPPVHRWREEATAWIHDQVRQEWKEDNPVTIPKRGGLAMPKRVVSTLQYKETVSLLLELYWRLSPNHRVLLAPSGSKMQAVGCYVVKALHPDIHIEYPSPEGFQPEYSNGIGTRWIIDFGDLFSAVQRITDGERRRFLEIAST